MMEVKGKEKGWVMCPEAVLRGVVGREGRNRSRVGWRGRMPLFGNYC